jgi:ribosomal protein S27E
MDNKYELGSTKVATEHHEAQQKTETLHATHCKFCGSENLVLSPSMHDHKCAECGEWQLDIPQGYSTGRSSDY